MTDGVNIAEWVHMLRCPNNCEAAAHCPTSAYDQSYNDFIRD